MKSRTIGVLLLAVIIWQWRKVQFFLLEYPAIDTDTVTINGKVWHRYVNGAYFTVGKDQLAADHVEEEIRKLLADPWELYLLRKYGPGKHQTKDLSALVVLEGIRRADERVSFMNKPFFG